MQEWTEDEAEAFARAAHAGQVDKAGEPYITHPLRVRARLIEPSSRMAALLHDVVEDCGVTPHELLGRGCPPAVVRAVVALTKQEGEPLESSLRRAAEDVIALEVKRADIADNSDPERLSRLPLATAERLTVKYRRSTALLDEFTASPPA